MVAPERRPDAAELTALGVDDWSSLLAVALPVVRGLPEPLVDPTVRRVAALPPGRLVSGRSRRDLARVLVREEVWELVEAALPDAAPRPWDGAPVGVGEPTPSDRPSATEVGRLQQQVDHLRAREERLAGKVADLREDVDRLRRERDGALARADSAGAAEQAAQQQLAAARRAVQEAQDLAAAADDRVQREVARAGRRDESEVAALREDLRSVRREREELRHERDRLRGELATQRRRAQHATGGVRPEEAAADPAGGRRGRPSRLPDGVTPGTRRAAQWLVAGGCELLVDGYNVTRTQRPDLPLAEQRRWLGEAVSALARRRQVDATIIWDSAQGRATTRRVRGGVTVRFTDAGVTADDELVLHVELAVDPDRPVVAVTDDVELRARLAKHGVDLLDSASFTWLL